MTYSRRQLYAFGETLGDSVTRKIAGRIVYGGGGGNPLSAAADLAGDVVGGAVDAVGDVAQAAGDVVQGGVDTVGDVIQGGANAVGDVVEGTGDVLGDIVQGAGNIIEDAGDAISDLGSTIDDAVNDIIPGGWTTVLAATAGMYGIPIEYITAAGATKGSKVLEGENFDLEGAIRGGAGAYGAGSLGAYGAEQLGTDAALESGAETGAVSSPVQTPTAVETPLPPVGETMTSAATPTQAAGVQPQGLETLPTSTVPADTALSPVVSQNAGSSQVYPVDRMGMGSDLPPSATAELVPGTASMDGAPVYDLSGPAAPMVETGTTGGNLLDAAGATVKNAAGAMGLDSLAGVAKGAAYAGLGLTALQALSAKNAGDKDAGKITNDQYLKTQAEIDKAIASAKEAVSMHPFEKDTAGAGLGRTLYQNNRTINQAGIKTLATGGSVNQYETPDTLMAGGITNSFHFAGGGMPSFGMNEFDLSDVSDAVHGADKISLNYEKAKDGATAANLVKTAKSTPASQANSTAQAQTDVQAQPAEQTPATRIAAIDAHPYQKSQSSPQDYLQGLGSVLYQQNKKQNYAHGGVANEPRFLSGGGDGMSDSIRANIDGHTEARLADGEFVVPADVVSHLGNGSSKAGAKQLYDMMDRIRKARTGNPKQGKQINPHKFLPK